MTTAEKWARKVLPLICEEYGIPQPNVTWRVAKGRQSGRWITAPKSHTSGHCWYRWPCDIVVTEGTNGPTEPKAVFLHEMAHAITRGKHDDKFYLVLWKLIRQYKLPIRECLAAREAPKGAGRRAYLATRPGRR